MEKVISVLRIEIVFSIKLTPATVSLGVLSHLGLRIHTQRLNVVLVPASLHVFHHQAGLPNLSVSYHPNLNYDTAQGF